MLKEHEKYKGYFYSKLSNKIIVNIHGNVLFDNGEVVKIRNDIYPRIYFKDNGKVITKSISSIVCETFLDKRHFSNPLVFHKDGDLFNNSLENLMWKENKDIQLEAAERKIQNEIKEYKIPLSFSSERGIFPNPIEHEEYKDFYYIPNTTSPILVNKKGEFFNLKNKEFISLVPYGKGYLNISLRRQNNKYKSTPTHRIVALLFCKIPEHHTDKDYNTLQVNHIDGNKLNNQASNLEWCDGFENMQHAHKLNLFSNHKKVLARNIFTNEILKYNSISDCARIHLVTTTALLQHLNSISSSRIPNEGFVFKYDDGSNWPSKLVENWEELSINFVCDVVAKNVLTEETYIFYSIKDACIYLKLDYTLVKLHRTRKGKNIPFNNFIFCPLSFYRGVL